MSLADLAIFQPGSSSVATFIGQNYGVKVCGVRDGNPTSSAGGISRVSSYMTDSSRLTPHTGQKTDANLVVSAPHSHSQSWGYRPVND